MLAVSDLLQRMIIVVQKLPRQSYNGCALNCSLGDRSLCQLVKRLEKYRHTNENAAHARNEG